MRNNVKLLIISIFIIFLSTSCGNSECAKMRNGHFKLVDKQTGYIYFVMRDNETQLEVDPIGQDTSIFAVEWINDCAYTLDLQKGTEGEKEFLNGRKLFVDIIEVNRDFYVFSSHIDNEEFEIVDTLFRLSE